MKPVETTLRNKQKARIYATDGESRWPIHGAILHEFGWRIANWHADGTYDGFPSLDIVDNVVIQSLPLNMEPDFDALCREFPAPKPLESPDQSQPR
jgi:hypothetical protein